MNQNRKSEAMDANLPNTSRYLTGSVNRILPGIAGVRMLLLLLLASTLLTACVTVGQTPTPTPTSTDAQPAEPAEERSAPLDDIFARPAESVGDLLVKASGVESTLTLIGDQGVRVTETMGQETRDTLDTFQANNAKTIQLLSEEYQGNLEVTIDSLDAGTQAILRNIEESLTVVNALLQDDIVLVTESSIEVIEAAGSELQQSVELLEQSVGNTVVLAGETTAYVIDRASNDTLAILSVLMLGIGFLLCIYLFFRHKIPEGKARYVAFALMIVYLIFFAVLTLSPEARAFLISHVLAAPTP
jgi:hypothetical protein